MNIISKTENYKKLIIKLNYGESATIQTFEEIVIQDGDETINISFNIYIYYLWDVYNEIEYSYLLSWPYFDEKKILYCLKNIYCNQDIFANYYDILYL